MAGNRYRVLLIAGNRTHQEAYAAAFDAARAAGVEAVCYACRLTTEEIRVDRPLPIAM